MLFDYTKITSADVTRITDEAIEAANRLIDAIAALEVPNTTANTLLPLNEAAAIIRETAHPDANMIFGAVIDENMGDAMRITVIATGFEREMSRRQVFQRYSRPGSQTGGVSQRQAAPQQPAAAQPAQPRREEPSRAKFSPQDLEIPAFLRRR